jgi:hypothetical protein
MPRYVRTRAAGLYNPGFLSRHNSLLGILLLSGLLAASLSSRAKNRSLDAVHQLVDTSGQSYFANAHPYIDEPLEQLVERIPDLKTIQPAPDQNALPMILTKTAVKVDELFRDAVDLLAHEEITQEKLNAKGSIKSSRRGQYNYLILFHRDEPVSTIEEYRTDSKGNRVGNLGLEKGYFFTSGFALSCIYFALGHRSGSTFRYLGDEMVGARNTYVVAFAQRPGQAGTTAKASAQWGSVTILLQGIAWVDESSFRIIRMRTDLLAPRSDIGLDRQTTEEAFSEVVLPDVAAPLWLPSSVSVYSVFKGNTFRNEHRYMEYQHYGVSVKMVPQ